MRVLESLERDHRLLQGLSDALEAYAAALEADQPLRAGDLSDLVHAFRNVADYRHFEKVEEVLIPWLVRHGFHVLAGFDFNLGRLDDERQERERVRYLIAVLHQSAEREPNWNIDERQRIVRGARHLVEAQRRISSHQAEQLFPQIVARFEPAVLGELGQQLWHFDETSTARSPELDVGALVKRVLARYAAMLPPRSSSSRELQDAVLQDAVLPPGMIPATLQSSRDLPPARELAR